MNKTKSSQLFFINTPRYYSILLLCFIILFFYWFYFNNSSLEHTLADINSLPKSSLFTYENISSDLFSDTRGVLFVSPRHQSSHFASIKSKEVRGNHRHKDSTNSITGEIIVLLQGKYQFRIGDGDTNQYEDHFFDISKIGVVALKLKPDHCHSLKNIGTKTSWFASYYIISKEIDKPTMDRNACTGMMLV